MVGFDSNPREFFVYFLNILLAHYVAVSYAMFCAASKRNFAEAALIGNLWFTLQSMASGYFVQISTIPVYVRWTRYICFIWYQFNALINNVFDGKTFPCPHDGGDENPLCVQYTGDFIMKSVDVKKGWVAVPMVIALAWAVFFYITAGVMLAFVPVDIDMAGGKARKDEVDTSAGKEKIVKREREGREIEVVLENLKLRVHKPSFFGKGGLDREILKGVSTRFEAGKLNVIMGPSGSGKVCFSNGKEVDGMVLTWVAEFVVEFDGEEVEKFARDEVFLGREDVVEWYYGLGLGDSLALFVCYAG